MNSFKKEVERRKDKLSLSSTSRKRKSSFTSEGKTKKLKSNKSEHVEVSKSLKEKLNTKVKRGCQNEVANEKEKHFIKGKDSPVCRKVKTGLKQLKRNASNKEGVGSEKKKPLNRKGNKLKIKRKTASLKGSTPSTSDNNNHSIESSTPENHLHPNKESNSSERFYALKSAWRDDEYLAESEELSITVARNIIKLFSEENTIPFIARYRNDLTGGLKPDKLRKVKDTFDYIQQVHLKKAEAVKLISVKEPLNSAILNSIKIARTVEELEFISAPYKKDSQKTLAERAKKLGLETPALHILEGEAVVNLESFVSREIEGLKNVEEVQSGIQHIMADIISKNLEVLTFLNKMKESRHVTLQTKFKAKRSEKEKNESKYKMYADFSQPVHTLKSHQVLAINRGEAEKELSVKIIIPEFLWTQLKNLCRRKYLSTGIIYTLRDTLISLSIEDAIKRLLSPFLSRRLRSGLTAQAKTEAVDVFGANLKQILLARPFPGKMVMGIDPGFKNGCKVAIVSAHGDFITSDKFFLHQSKLATEKLTNLVSTYGCTTVALGDGVGCRETESLLSELIKKKKFQPYSVSYTIISENGVSIYSCSSAAEKEFPGLEPTVVSAISMARRLQNPLSELVKVEPQHLGVGLYQHDVEVKKLASTLNDIVSECVSFVGVDVNTASIHLLKRVAGLTESKAKEIVKYRTENCLFTTREDLKKVKGIKDKTFQQCAGFIRIVPSTATLGGHSQGPNEFDILDQTQIHPESYKTATDLIKRLNLQIEDLGSKEFIDAVKRKVEKTSAQVLAETFKCSVPSMAFILDVLMKPRDYDLRIQRAGPIFREEIKNLKDLWNGQILAGVVRNVVPFGAFVDIGVGKHGLIHVSKMKNKTLEINDRVMVEVTSLDLNSEKVQLKLLQKEEFV